MCVNGDVDVTGCLTTNQSSGLEDTATASIDCYRCPRISPFGTAVVPGLALFCAGTNWYYEVTLLTAGLMQIGWATSKFLDVKTTIDSTGRHVKGHGDGCGDDLHSWGYCGSRGLLWHGNSVTMHYESPSSSVDLAKWKAGDVVGCCLRVEEALPTEASKKIEYPICVYFLYPQWLPYSPYRHFFL